MKDFIITIDGASSSGKSTLAKGLAKHFGFKHIDSGAMYRALTYYALELQLLGEDCYKIK
jgi:cytidylate kinase